MSQKIFSANTMGGIIYHLGLSWRHSAHQTWPKDHWWCCDASCVRVLVSHNPWIWVIDNITPFNSCPLVLVISLQLIVVFILHVTTLPASTCLSYFRLIIIYHGNAWPGCITLRLYQLKTIWYLHQKL